LKPKLVVLTGAGVSAESGINTFRAADGFWENHKVEDVATPEAFLKDPRLVLKFYDERRKQALKARPNQAHLTLAELERWFDVQILTQNVDDLHERAGSTNVTHLHGDLFTSRSSLQAKLRFEIGANGLHLGDLCPLGSQLRPDIVWFGEGVPMIEIATKICQEADYFAVIGTSLLVYPAAGLVNYCFNSKLIYLVDPLIPEVNSRIEIIKFAKRAGVGVPLMKADLLQRINI
jgi:NAD-dependent deacetylase